MERFTFEKRLKTETQHGAKKLTVALLAVAATVLATIQTAEAQDDESTAPQDDKPSCCVSLDEASAAVDDAKKNCKCTTTEPTKQTEEKPKPKKAHKKNPTPVAPTSFTERNHKMPKNISFPCVLRTDYGENSGYKLTMALPYNSVEREGDVEIGDLKTVEITRLHDSGDIAVDLKNEHKANGDDALTYGMATDPSDKLERITTCQLERSLPPKTSTSGDCPRQIQLDIETQVVGGFLDATIKEVPKGMNCATYHLPNPNPIPGTPSESDFYCWTKMPNFQTGETDTCAYGTALKQPLPPEDPKKPRKPEEVQTHPRHTLLPY